MGVTEYAEVTEVTDVIEDDGLELTVEIVWAWEPEPARDQVTLRRRRVGRARTALATGPVE